MIKRYLTLLAIIFLAITSYAQETHFGVKGGMNLSTISGNVGEEIKPRLAYHFGGFAAIPLSDSFSLNPELLYSSIGHTFNFATEAFIGADPSSNFSFKTAERANYLALPINFRYSFTKKFGLDFGPQIGFLLNRVNKIKEASSVDPIFVENRRFSGNFRPDYGLNLGVTFSPSEKINVQLRFYHGLKNLLEDNFYITGGRDNIALQLAVGYVLF